MTDTDNNDTEQDKQIVHHVPGSRVVHHSRDCHHLDNAAEVEEMDAEEAEDYRTCYQCNYDQLSHEEKMRRKRKQRRSRRTKTVTVRYR